MNTDTPERELIEANKILAAAKRVHVPHHDGMFVEHSATLAFQNAATRYIEALLARVDKLEEALRVIEKLRLSGMETAAQGIARATLNRSAS